MQTSLAGQGERRKGRRKLLILLLTPPAVLACLAVVVWRAFFVLPPLNYTPPPLPNPNAFDDYCRAGEMIRAIPEEERKRAYDRKTPIAEVAATVSRCRPAFAAMRRGFAYSYCTPIPKDPFTDEMPYLADFRWLARMLVAESRVRTARGDIPGALDSLFDALRLGGDVPRGGPLLHALVGYAIESVAEQELIALARLPDPAQCRQTLQRLRKVEAGRPPLADSLRVERYFMRKALPAAIAQGAHEGSSLPGAATFANTLWRPALVEVDRTYVETIRQAPLPARRRRLPTPSRIPTARALAGLPGDVMGSADRADCRYRLLETELALRAYRLEHRRPAAALADLVPAYLPAVPVDPFGDGGPLRYQTGSDPHAYSVGFDGKDDRGMKVIPWPKAKKGAAGDLVVVLGERPAPAK